MAEEEGLVFVIDGKDYLSPDISTFEMHERRVMFELCGIVQEDFMLEADESEAERDARVAKMVRHPGFMESLMHVAYARGNPGLKREKVQAVIDNTNYLEAIEKWGETEDDASPPELTSVLDKSSPSETLDSSESSGTPSTNGLEEAVSVLVPIGTTK